MTVQGLLDLIAALSTSVDALIAKGVPPAIDLQPVADALTAVKTKVDTAVAG